MNMSDVTHAQVRLRLFIKTWIGNSSIYVPRKYIRAGTV